MHACVPYDTVRQLRLMCRMNFECDPPDDMNHSTKTREAHGFEVQLYKRDRLTRRDQSGCPPWSAAQPILALV
jgi:hypothetical protein